MDTWSPEILAPAGSPDCLPAAVAGGANAVYLGLRHFNARGRAENFRLADLPNHMDYLHHHGLKGYVVLNTLLHDDEFNKALDMACRAHQAGIDAVLVQDLGLWHCLREHIPDLELHASTQMTVHCKSQIKQLAGLGAKRIVLARELSAEELQALTTYAASLDVETEHFIHGALCYAFSGQCLMSNFSGCRSANRGTCAQNCRYDYQSRNANDYDTVISMKDLSLIDAVPMMANAGVASLKIEGRLKGPDYVYTVSHSFRQAVDAWVAKKSLQSERVKEELKRVFSRGHTSAPIDGIYDQRSRLSRQQLDQTEKADAVIIRIDRQRGEALLRAQRAPQVGQGFSMTLGQFRDGFLITHVEAKQEKQWQCKIRIQEQGAFIPSQTPVYLNSDQAFKQEVEQAIKSIPTIEVKKPLKFTLSGAVDEPLVLNAGWGDISINIQSEIPLQVAQKQSLDDDRLQATLAALGETDFTCESLINNIQGSCFLPNKYLKQMRRDCIAQLEQAQRDQQDATPSFAIVPSEKEIQQRSTKIICVVGSVDAIDDAFEQGADYVCLDDPLLDLWSNDAQELHLPENTFIRHSPIRYCSPHIAQIGVPVLAGHIGVIEAAQRAGLSSVADHYCNVVNSWTLKSLAQQGVDAAILSLECSAREVARLCARCHDPALPHLWLTVHGRLPSMLTRQDHGLVAGQQQLIQAHQRDGGLAYEIQRRLDHDTVLWEARRLLASRSVMQTCNLVDGWVLELADLDKQGVAAFTAAYVQLRDGVDVHGLLSELCQSYYRHGTFPGHLETGSRALDDLQMQQRDA